MCISCDHCLAQSIECCIVTLKKITFNEILVNDKLEIIKIGRPKCELNQELSNKSLNVNLYEQVLWLTGCSKLNKLFCWACLLFNNSDTNQWTNMGFNDTENQLKIEIQLHEQDKKHISAVQQLEEMKIEINDEDFNFMDSKFDDDCLTNFLSDTNSETTNNTTVDFSEVNSSYSESVNNEIENNSDEIIAENLIQKLVKHRLTNTELTMDNISTFLMEIKNILHNGKPRPELPSMRKVFSANPSYIYDTVPWLIGCDVTNKLFCLPCLFFNPQAIPLNTIGYDLIFLLSQVKYHSNDEKHLLAVSKMEEMYRNIELLESSPSQQDNFMPMDPPESTSDAEMVELVVDNPDDIIQTLTSHSPDIDLKIDIVLKGRPGYDSMLHLPRENSYNLMSWITQCSVTKKLYCWPCLLFDSERCKWNSEGFSNVSVCYQAAFHCDSDRHKSAVREHYACLRNTGVYNELLDKQGDSEERDWLLCKLGVDYDVISKDLKLQDNSKHDDTRDMVHKLLSIPADHKDRLTLILSGRPTPALPGFNLLNFRSRDKSVNLYFYAYRKFYSVYKWLTGCSTSNKLYCWPCLYFNPVDQVWTKQGFGDFHSEYGLHDALKKHGETCEHREALERFGTAVQSSQQSDDNTSVESCETEKPCNLENVPQVTKNYNDGPTVFNTIASEDVVEKILEIPLKDRPNSSKIQYYLTLLKPAPVLASQLRETDVSLDSNMYVKHEWITASTTHQKLFCWPCLLFNQSDGNWSAKGSHKVIKCKIDNHVKKLSHKLALIKLVELKSKN